MPNITHNKRASEPVSEVSVRRVVFRGQIVGVCTPSTKRVGQRREHERERWELAIQEQAPSCILTDENGEPVAPQSTREDDEQEARSEHEGEEDDGFGTLSRVRDHGQREGARQFGYSAGIGNANVSTEFGTGESGVRIWWSMSSSVESIGIAHELGERT